MKDTTLLSIALLCTSLVLGVMTVLKNIEHSERVALEHEVSVLKADLDTACATIIVLDPGDNTDSQFCR